MLRAREPEGCARMLHMREPEGCVRMLHMPEPEGADKFRKSGRNEYEIFGTESFGGFGLR